MTVVRVLVVAVIAAVMAAVLFVVAPPAQACGPWIGYNVLAEMLVGDFNAPDSELNDDYRAWADHTNAANQTIEIWGAYVYESVHWEAETGNMTAASVSVLVEVWGEWPQSREPRVVPRIDKDVDCPFPQGVAVGERSYALVTSEGELSFNADDSTMPVLTAAFGAPETAARDFDLEAELISQLQAVDTGSSLPLALGGVGLVALLGAGAFWKYTRRPSPVTNPEG